MAQGFRPTLPVLAVLLLLAALPAATAEAPAGQPDGGKPERLSATLVTDAAYHTLAGHIPRGTHYAPVTGPYNGFECRTTANLAYDIPTPLGGHWLLSGAHVTLGGKLELTPVSIKPGASISFTPVPFLVFSAGADAGTGWNFFSFEGGMSRLDACSCEYETLGAFRHWYLKGWAQGTFQFDVGAVIPGDWTHVALRASYQLYYQRLTGVDDGEVWMWQRTGNRVNGAQQYVNIALAYQMPLTFSMVGVLFEVEGYLDGDAFDPEKYGGYNSTFQTISIGPLFQFTFSPRSVLLTQPCWSSRRSFKEDCGNNDSREPTYTYSGREWYFFRFAASYTYKF